MIRISKTSFLQIITQTPLTVTRIYLHLQILQKHHLFNTGTRRRLGRTGGAALVEVVVLVLRAARVAVSLARTRCGALFRLFLKMTVVPRLARPRVGRQLPVLGRDLPDVVRVSKAPPM